MATSKWDYALHKGKPGAHASSLAHSLLSTQKFIICTLT